MNAILAVTAVGLSGAAVAAFVPMRTPARAALGVLFGLGIWSAAYSLVLFAAGNTPATLFVKDAALAAGGAAVLLWRRGKSRAPPVEAARSTLRWPVAAAIAACVLATAFFIEHTLRYPDGGWDAWAIWNLRARFLARAGPGFRAAFSPEILFWAHQDYPLLVPGVVAHAFQLVGAQPLWVPAAVSYLFAALAVALLAAAAGELRGAPWSSLAALALVATPSFVALAANQQADVPDGAFVLAACTLIAAGIESGALAHFAVAGLAASLGAWTKNEGTLHLICLGFALLAVRWAPLRQRVRAALCYSLAALPVLALLAYFKLTVARANDLFFDPSALRLLEPHRWGELALALARRAVFFQSWALWLVAEIAVLAFVIVRLPPRASARAIGIALSLSFAVTFAVYLIQPHPLVWFFRASIDRVLIQLWPSALLATVLAIAPARAEVDSVEGGPTPSRGEEVAVAGARPSPHASANDR
ncbi:MAG TPA: glycosyltransferase family 39 protein [Myxococcales bacterium]|nr:glycosyltransferase family 39 protein [Myxococcales bacterium]